LKDRKEMVYGDMMIEVNNIYNMDCLEGLKQMEDCSVDCIIIDPPYNINFKPQRGTFDIIENDNMSWDDFDNFMQPIINECFRVLKDDSFMFVFTGFSSSSSSFYKYTTNSGFKVKAQLVWVKNNFGLGYYFRPQHEDIWACMKGKPSLPKRALSTVLFEKKVNGADLLHSCEKPQELIRKLIKQYCVEGGVVLDCFAGSGSTLLASKQLGRPFIGFEILKDNCVIIEDRLKQKVMEDWF
jgi:site-specific DNA-methyltransferase (adenine-specific)